MVLFTASNMYLGAEGLEGEVYLECHETGNFVICTSKCSVEGVIGLGI